MNDLVLPTPSGLDPAEAKCHCAELWGHPLVRLLIGDAFRPGGLDLTATLVGRLGLTAGARVLDVGCGTGATLRLLQQAGMVPLGVDLSSALVAEASRQGAAVVGDAERLPFAPDRFDAVLMECVLSALPDKGSALDGTRRVLRPGGRLLLSDVTLEGSFPEPLSSLVSWVACTAGALGRETYPALLEERGFTVEEITHHDRDLRALVSKARRRFALLAGAANTGILDGLDPAMLPGGDAVPADDPEALLRAGRDTLAQLAAAVDAGDLGYVAIVASA